VIDQENITRPLISDKMGIVPLRKELSVAAASSFDLLGNPLNAPEATTVLNIGNSNFAQTLLFALPNP